jgi:DNA processing protein
MDNEKMYYNAIAIALEGDPLRVRKLFKKCVPQFHHWQDAYDILKEESLESGFFSPPNPERAWDELEKRNIKLALFQEEDYPSLLREIYDPPFGLYYRGTLPKENTFAIVGTRRATVEGKNITKKFARVVAHAGFTIASGLALGIDAAGHEGCLEASGVTVAILAGGLDDIYPATNDRLAHTILEKGGALISEYPLHEPPYAYRFLERNRIVSGLSKGVLVVESPKNSGSLVTARLALEQNRDVFVVPRNSVHPNFFGSHALIRQGATLVTQPEEILEVYEIMLRDDQPPQETFTNEEEKQVLLALRSIGTAANVDKIIAMTKLEPRIINRALSFLIIKQLVKETELGYIIE